MKYTTFSLIAGIVFALVAIVHLLRIIQGWDISVNGIENPLWVNWAGLVVAGVLAFYGLWLGIKKPLASV